MTGSQRGSVMGERRQSEVGSVVSYATANTNASRYTHLGVAAQAPCASSKGALGQSRDLTAALHQTPHADGLWCIVQLRCVLLLAWQAGQVQMCRKNAIA